MDTNRRDFLTILGTAAVANIALAQAPTQSKPPEKTKAQMAKEYETCKVRGHVPDSSKPVAFPPPQQQGYVAETSGPWQTCYYCGKQYRFVTKIEEKDAA